MEQLKICYIWIEQFRNFENQGLNFSSSEKFDFDQSSNKIVFERVKKLPDDFYGNRIVDVAALIGKNGAGKSNALELLCKLLKSGKSSVKGDFFIIVQHDDHFVCYHSMPNFSPECNFPLYFERYERGIDPLKIIFFSNVFDERIHNFDADVSDLSANKRYRFNRFPSSRKNKTDFEKQISFIETEAFKHTQIPSPIRIQITSKVWSSPMHTSTFNSLSGPFYEELKFFISTYRSRLNDIKSNNKFYYLIVYSFFLETLKNLRNSNLNTRDSANHYLQEFISNTGLYKNERTEGMVNDMIKWMEYISNEISKDVYSSKSEDSILFKNQLILLKKIQDSEEKIEVGYDYEGRGNKNTETFYFDYNYINYSHFKDYLDLIDKNTLFEINWLGISSGHKAYLNLFSLIYHEVKRVKKNNLLLCIDEGDLYLHPKWQVEFFDKLVTILPMIFSGQIQIVLTSHSPFLLSDLPKQSITIIGGEKGKIIDGTVFTHETFAGNIYNLYEEPFFLGGQRISTFADKKIRMIIYELQHKNLNRSEIQDYISLIGDDVIRFHLQKRFKND